MKLFKMKNNRNKILLVLCLTLSCIQNNYAQDKEKKINVIIDSLRTVESIKSTYIEFGLKPLKFEATKEDSIKLIGLENLLTDKEIRRRLIAGFNDAFTDNEINDLYSFINTTAFFKLLHSSISNKSISNHFKDIRTELDKITANEDDENKINKKPVPKFEQIQIERVGGFYETVDYVPNSEKKDIQLEKNPALTKDDILEVKKVTNKQGNSHIEISLNKKGARIFHILTKNNIGKPIAIVIDRYIVTLPTVNSTITGGKMDITGNFSNDEIDKMIKKLKEK
jgi:preprotein translocase subunit SecD